MNKNNKKTSYLALIKPILAKKDQEIVKKCIYDGIEFYYDGEQYIHLDDFFRQVFYLSSMMSISDYNYKIIEILD